MSRPFQPGIGGGSSWEDQSGWVGEEHNHVLRSPHEVHPGSLGRTRDTIAGEKDIFVPARPGRGRTRSETPHVILPPTSTANGHVRHRSVPFSIGRKGSNLLSDVRTSTRHILCERCGVFSGGNPPPRTRLLGPFAEVRVSIHPPTNRSSAHVPLFSPSFSIAIFLEISMRVGLDTIPLSDAPRKGGGRRRTCVAGQKGFVEHHDVTTDRRQSRTARASGVEEKTRNRAWRDRRGRGKECTCVTGDAWCSCRVSEEGTKGGRVDVESEAGTTKPRLSDTKRARKGKETFASVSKEGHEDAE